MPIKMCMTGSSRAISVMAMAFLYRKAETFMKVSGKRINLTVRGNRRWSMARSMRVNYLMGLRMATGFIGGLTSPFTRVIGNLMNFTATVNIRGQMGENISGNGATI